MCRARLRCGFLRWLRHPVYFTVGRRRKPSSRKTYEDLLSEKAFQSRVIGIARENGFVLPPVDPTSKIMHRRRPFVLCYHTYSSKRSVPGFPDLVLVHPETGRTIFAELKKNKEYPTPEQRRWLEALSKNPHLEVYVWKPKDLATIREILGGNDSRLYIA